MENQIKKDFLSVEDLVVEYTSEGEIVHAVNGVSFKLKEGDAIGLVGETGAGKTTIAKSILRILPTPQATVKSGSIFLDGEELLGLDDKKMRKIRGNKVTMIFQDPMTALDPTMRVGKQIAECVRIQWGYSQKKAEERALEVFKDVGLSEDRFMEYPHQFSGGMKQRVVIAMALVCKPQLLIADEPTTALDVTIQAQILDMISGLQKEKNLAMVMITHDLGIVAKTCDNVAVVYAGQIIEYGTTRQVFTNPSHPYTVGLFKAIPSIKEDVEKLATIKGLPADPTELPPGCNFWPRCPYATEACKADDIPMFDLGEGHVCRCLRSASGKDGE